MLPVRSTFFAFVLCVLPLSAGLLGLPASSHAQAVEASEEKVKAAYLYKFLNYVEWPANLPASPGAPYLMGVIGDNRVADELAGMIAGKTANNRPITSRRFAYGEPLTGAAVPFVVLGVWLKRRQARFEAALADVDTATIRTVDEEIADQLRER